MGGISRGWRRRERVGWWLWNFEERENEMEEFDFWALSVKMRNKDGDVGDDRVKEGVL